MKSGPYVGFIVLVLVFASGMVGMLIGRRLPKSHLNDATKAVVTVCMGIVGTLTALVLGLLISTASTAFNTRAQQVTQMAANLIQLDHLLRHYGPEAGDERDLLRRFTAMKIEDSFPQSARLPKLENPRTVSLLEELQRRLATMESHTPEQRWLQSQAQTLTSEVVEARWLLIEQDAIGISVPVLVLVLFWLCLLFVSFGMFAPQNATVAVVLFFCALAVAGAIQTIVDLSRPFEGLVRVSGQPLRHALQLMSEE
jgi:hypothetical protein